MSIRIEINLEPGDTFESKLRAYFPSVFESAGPIFAGENVTPNPPEGTAPAGWSNPYNPSSQPILRDEEGRPVLRAMPTTLHERVQAEAPPEKPKRGPGRPRKAVTEAEQAERIFTVRRNGGAIEGEYQDSGTATEVLIGLMKSAGDVAALTELHAVNKDELAGWPAERVSEIDDAYVELDATLRAGEPEPAPDVEAPGPHKDLEGNEMTSLSRNKASARNAVQAYVTAKGNAGMEWVRGTLFKELGGMSNISSLADDDERHGQIVDRLAPMLGLPVA